MSLFYRAMNVLSWMHFNVDILYKGITLFKMDKWRFICCEDYIWSHLQWSEPLLSEEQFTKLFPYGTIWIICCLRIIILYLQHLFPPFTYFMQIKKKDKIFHLIGVIYLGLTVVGHRMKQKTTEGKYAFLFTFCHLPPLL